MPTTEKKILRECERSLAFWQRALGLQNWEISLALSPNLTHKGAAAEVAVSWELGEAIVLINPESFMEFQDAELTEALNRAVVHELLHVFFWPFHPPESDELKYSLFEQTLNRLGRVLVDLAFASSEQG